MRSLDFHQQIVGATPVEVSEGKMGDLASAPAWL